ncbi:hypothetical protein GDI2457 [Gluconacetobacter diazotrophicus PA1 5]|uniref:Uncharacterized protein n=1 Tax=Gluconacetobacter diazotrophicus (strain ATCC 49037 / DSM 5601 / CCUG 37298 / CIP 103539 / LMG 7603 / PAl5) TaxID=272568 RepID=A9HN66_GLUDA|nr:hypothetical protein GDI2457 [Gluconacetobacter diazotrophicus PA1 5]
MAFESRYPPGAPGTCGFESSGETRCLRDAGRYRAPAEAEKTITVWNPDDCPGATEGCNKVAHRHKTGVPSGCHLICCMLLQRLLGKLL